MARMMLLWRAYNLEDPFNVHERGNATNSVCAGDAIAFMRKHGGATGGIW